MIKENKCTIHRLNPKDLHKYKILEGISTWTIPNYKTILFCKDDIAYLNYEKGTVVLKDGSSFGINKNSEINLECEEFGWFRSNKLKTIPSISCNCSTYTISYDGIDSNSITEIIERVLYKKGTTSKVLFHLMTKRKKNSMIFKCFSKKLLKAMYIELLNYRKYVISSNKEFEETQSGISRDLDNFVKKFNLYTFKKTVDFKNSSL